MYPCVDYRWLLAAATDAFEFEFTGLSLDVSGSDSESEGFFVTRGSKLHRVAAVDCCNPAVKGLKGRHPVRGSRIQKRMRQEDATRD